MNMLGLSESEAPEYKPALKLLPLAIEWRRR